MVFFISFLIKIKIYFYFNQDHSRVALQRGEDQSFPSLVVRGEKTVVAGPISKGRPSILAIYIQDIQDMYKCEKVLRPHVRLIPWRRRFESFVRTQRNYLQVKLSRIFTFYRINILISGSSPHVLYNRIVVTTGCFL